MRSEEACLFRPSGRVRLHEPPCSQREVSLGLHATLTCGCHPTTSIAMRILRGVANRLRARDATRNSVDRVPHLPLPVLSVSTSLGLTPPPYIGVISLHRTVTVSAMSVRSARTQASVARSGRRSGCNVLIPLYTVWQPCWINTRCPRVLTALWYYRTPKAITPCQAVAGEIPLPSGGRRSGGRLANRR